MFRSRTVPIFLSLILSLAVLTCVSVAQGDDEAAVRDVVRRLEAGWNAGSGEGFAAPFAEDADYVAFDGSVIKSRPTIAAGHQQLFDTVFKGSTNTPEVLGLRFLRPDVAVTQVRWTLRHTQGGAPAEAQAVTTLVLTRGADGWSIAAFQNTPVAPPRPPG
jgi:uncharacterized protein (TIGR02246 family)